MVADEGKSQRELVLRQQMKTIKEELGEGGDDDEGHAQQAGDDRVAKGVGQGFETLAFLFGGARILNGGRDLAGDQFIGRYGIPHRVFEPD